MSANPSTGLTGGRYTLPAEMGGHECWRVPRSAMVGDCVSVAYEMRGEMVTSVVPSSWLTPVKPPLPVQPSQGAIRIDSHGVVWQRNGGLDSRMPWYAARDLADMDWEALNEQRGPLRTVVLDPFAEPVQLPWSDPSSVVDVVGKVVTIRLGSGANFGYTPSAARDHCRAVWAAANQADKAGETT